MQVYLSACLVWSLLSATPAPEEPGGRIEFSLPDAYGHTVTLNDFADAPAVVLVFLGTECPLVKLYTLRLEQLNQRFREQKVVFLGINSNRQDTLTKIQSFIRHQQLTFPILKDNDAKLADRMGAERTPEVFVLDRARQIRYQGRVDDQYGIGYSRPEPTRADLVAAIEDVLAGREVEVPRTKPLGCLIGRSPKVEPTGSVTYSNHISRLLNERCVECHRPGEIGPFSLTSYEDAVSWGEMIKEVVVEGRMPPWFADPAYGTFRDDGHFSEEDRNLVVAWVENGCPEGDPADLPPAPEFVEGWGMGTPDLVFPMSDTPFQVPAEGSLDYLYYTIDPGWTEDIWLCGSEARPGNREVVHHILVFIARPGKKYLPGLPGELISAYAPGMRPTIGDPGMAVRVPAGSKIIMQMHYTPNGRATEDLSHVGFRIANPEEIQYEVRAGMAINIIFRIPPHDPNYRVVAIHKFDRDALLLGLNPHMHLRGKAFRYEAHYPDGSKEILMDVPRFDFNWQLGYKFDEPKPMPAGTRMVCTAYFDNSAENPNNPDPNRTVRFGEQTWDEMMIGWFFSAEPKEQFAKIP